MSVWCSLWQHIHGVLFCFTQTEKHWGHAPARSLSFYILLLNYLMREIKKQKTGWKQRERWQMEKRRMGGQYCKTTKKLGRGPKSKKAVLCVEECVFSLCPTFSHPQFIFTVHSFLYYKKDKTVTFKKALKMAFMCHGSQSVFPKIIWGQQSLLCIRALFSPSQAASS